MGLRIEAQRDDDGSPFGAPGVEASLHRAALGLRRVDLSLQLALGLDELAPPALDLGELPERLVGPIAGRGQELVAGAGGLAEGLERLEELAAVRGQLAIEGFHLAPPASDLGGKLDEVAPELEPAPHLAGGERPGRQARPDGGPFTPELLAAVGDALLLARQELQRVAGPCTGWPGPRPAR